MLVTVALTFCSKEDDSSGVPPPVDPKEYSFFNPETYTIPDNANAGIASLITVSGIPLGATIKDVRVSTQIRHSWIGELSIWLVAPDGQTRIGLMERPGVPATVHGSQAQFTQNNTISFTNSATVSSEEMGADLSIDIPSGSWLPSWDSELAPPAYSNFPGFTSALPANVNGEWKLYIRDSRAGAGTGYFKNVRLVITAQ